MSTGYTVLDVTEETFNKLELSFVKLESRQLDKSPIKKQNTHTQFL